MPETNNPPTCAACPSTEGLRATHFGDDQLCEGCGAECAECGDFFNREDLNETTSYPDGRYSRATTVSACDDCRFECADCGRDFVSSIGDYGNPSGRSICAGCSEDYYHCDSCDAMLHADDCYTPDGGDGTYCESCYSGRDEEGDSEGMFGHDYRPELQFATASGERTDRLTPYYGIEIECEAPGRRRDLVQHVHSESNRFFYCKHDGSLNNGIEVVSQPATFAHWMARDMSPFTWLASKGCRSFDTDTCGMHIHVSRSALSQLAQTKLCRLFGSDPRFILKVSRRSPDKLRQWARVDDSELGAIVRKVKGITNDGRYMAVNLTNRATIEIRIFRGTLKVESIRLNIALVHAMVTYARLYAPKDMTIKAFVSWLAGRGRDLIGKETAGKLHKWLSKNVSREVKPEPALTGRDF